jgi:hypothetical protein
VSLYAFIYNEKAKARERKIRRAKKNTMNLQKDKWLGKIDKKSVY